MLAGQVPGALKVGGNTGKVNSFAGVDLGNLTGIYIIGLLEPEYSITNNPPRGHIQHRRPPPKPPSNSLLPLPTPQRGDSRRAPYQGRARGESARRESERAV